MKCPKCDTVIRLPIGEASRAYDARLPWEENQGFDIAHGFCPQCEQLIILLRHGPVRLQDPNDDSSAFLSSVKEEEVVYPPSKVDHRRLEKEIPTDFRSDYAESEKTLPLSPKASAALSRRLLQRLLREEIKVRPSRLVKEIDEFLAGPGIPTHISEAIDAIRVVGNFAAHPMKDTNTGEILEVEPGEAEWLLDVIESLFDFVFVQPRRLEARRTRLNEKLESIKRKNPN